MRWFNGTDFAFSSDNRFDFSEFFASLALFIYFRLHTWWYLASIAAKSDPFPNSQLLIFASKVSSFWYLAALLIVTSASNVSHFPMPIRFPLYFLWLFAQNIQRFGKIFDLEDSFFCVLLYLKELLTWYFLLMLMGWYFEKLKRL